MATRLDTKYAKDPRKALRGLGALEYLPDEAVAQLEQHCRWVYLKPGQRLSRSALRETSCHYFVVEGQVGVVRSPASDPDTINLKLDEGVSELARQYVTLFEPNDSFSDAYLGLRARREAIDCVALRETMLVSIYEAGFNYLLDHNAAWRAAVAERAAEHRSRYLKARDPATQVVQDFFIHQNYNLASTLKVIDLDACIGCDGCERACGARHGVPRLKRDGPVLGRLSFPISCRTCEDHRCLPACGFNALTMKDDELRIDKSKCVGCRACFDACPNSVITMIETPYASDDFPDPMPNTDLEGRTNVPGLYLVGEAAGAALIKVAANGGVAAAQSIAKELAPRSGPPGVHDVAIVGAGPAGLAAALQCQEAGLEFVLFDKGAFAKTIHTYPREKVVMAEPAHIPKYGTLWLRNTNKEELIQKWTEVIETTKLQINSFESVTAVTKGADGNFDITSDRGQYRAQRVVLAMGNRGMPRRLGVEGETEPRVEYALTDPEPYDGKHVLVVGGGDSAVEAAMSLADFGAHVALSYRRDSFGRIKGGNQTRLDEYKAEGKVRVVLSSTVTQIAPGKVVLKTTEGPLELRNDTIFALLGAEPPTAFFEACGIEIIQPKTPAMAALAKTRGTRFYANKCDHCAGFSDQACIQACPTGAIFEVQPDEVFIQRDPISGVATFKTEPFVEGLTERAGSPALRKVASAAALLAVVATVLVGLECFARTVMPELSATAWLAPHMGWSGSITFEAGEGLGFWLGIIGMSCMGLTALYPLNSRLGWARRFAKTRFWLALHVVAGLMGPALVSYHTMLKLDRWPSVGFWAMWLVVMSGVLGRYAATALRRGRGVSALESESLQSRRAALMERAASGHGLTQIARLDDLLKDRKRRHNVLLAPITLPLSTAWSWLQVTWHNWIELRKVADPELRRHVAANARSHRQVLDRKRILETLERSAGMWRKIHLGLTVTMFGIATLHVVVALMYRTG
ncbi:MAG: NAD(P)-binding domain-containing protein [Deltaproteobacteria bacterium]|nr:NAD(P)-binding domain-containing protein [Deltaproteobacteria bacterium]